MGAWFCRSQTIWKLGLVGVWWTKWVKQLSASLLVSQRVPLSCPSEFRSGSCCQIKVKSSPVARQKRKAVLSLVIFRALVGNPRRITSAVVGCSINTKSLTWLRLVPLEDQNSNGWLCNQQRRKMYFIDWSTVSFMDCPPTPFHSTPWEQWAAAVMHSGNHLMSSPWMVTLEQTGHHLCRLWCI